MLEIDLSLLLILATVALLAGFFDAIAGGGGLITLPVLFIAGLDPLAALATNKFQAASATVSATWAFARRGMLDWNSGLPMALMAFVGGALGALSVSLVPHDLLQAGVPVLLILVAAYFAFSPRLDDQQLRKPRIPPGLFCLLIAPLLGFYDGVFGPGVGSFFMLAFMLLLGQGMLRSVGNSKLLNAACNLGALLVFAASGKLLWPLALVMALCAMLGAQLGARCAVHFGPRLIRPLVVCVCTVMATKLLMDVGNPLVEWVADEWP
ncbi:TSUP family transporter [Pseudomonas putida CSV86]|uniref:Probable membrane transporter protein n=1 Tax=Pseudomonas bharatica CSV86 TaxID=1005395 RepID=L1M3J0_9PSED|nr:MULTISPECIES: TSUP family transporter [Pseudomonas]MDG9884670.1 TSUP family transporter [Pseudomonas sp. GD04058]NNJ19223.1 TSUP family transporter [Pseudomonas bharatica CSV86]